MGYDRLRPSEPGSSGLPQQQQQQQQKHEEVPEAKNNKRKLVWVSVIAFTMLIVSAVCAGLVIGFRKGGADPLGTPIHRKPTRAISKTCSKTRYPNLCVDSLLQFPGSLTATEQDLVHISFNMTLQHFSKALYSTTSFSYLQMDPLLRSAYDDCLELLEDSVDALYLSLTSVIPSDDQNKGGGNNNQDVMTWLSAALTNQDTCTEGFDGIVSGSTVKDQVAEKLKDLSELVSNCLSIFAASGGDDFSGVPIQNRRRRLLANTDEDDISGEINVDVDEENFPKWVGRKERELLNTPVSAIQADIIVSKDGSGTVRTITEAIKKAPEHSPRRIIIYVRAGR